MLKITDEIFIEPSELSSMEYVFDDKDYWGNKIVGGTILTMKSGRKIFVKCKTPHKIERILNAEGEG